MKEYDTIFPHDKMINGSIQHEHGLTVRDYIAIKAMQGILANPKLIPNFDTAMVENVASRAYEFADDMIKWSEI